MNPNLTIIFEDKRGQWNRSGVVYHEPDGILGFIKDLNKKKEVLDDPDLF